MSSGKKIVLLCTLLVLAVPAFGAANQDIPQYQGDLAARSHLNTFIVLGDSKRSSFWEFWKRKNDFERKEIIEKVASENPAFVIHTGDLVSRGSSSGNWQWFDNYAAVLRERQIPLFPVLGNHEYYGNNKTAMRHFFSRFSYLENRRWSAFSFRSVGIILLDSNFHELTEDQIKSQQQFYLRKLQEFEANPSIATILVACHHPPFTNCKHVAENKRVQEFFAAPFIKASKTKLFFSGHCHSYEHFVIDQKHFIVTGGAGAARHKLSRGKTPDNLQDLCSHGVLPDFHFCRITIQQNNGLQVEIVHPDAEFTHWIAGEKFLVR